MKLVYDARWLPIDNRFDGIGRYSRELGAALAVKFPGQITWLIKDERQLQHLPREKFLLVNDFANIPAELMLGKYLNALAPDVVYSPFFMMGNLSRRYKLVLTVHDLIYFHYRTPSLYFPWFVRATWWLFYSAKWPMRTLLNSADIVATVSQTAADEIVTEHMTKRPLRVVPNAAEFSQKDEPETATGSHAKSHNIVYMGAFTPYKNVDILVEAMAGLPDCQLHLLSKIPRTRRHELEQLAQANGISSHIVFHDGVSDETYHELLQTARCLVAPSKCEGFGLPILEAQNAGTPVVCSDMAIFREVAGEGALFFSPDSKAELVEAIRALADTKISRNLIKKGNENVKRFSWQQSADYAAEIINSLHSSEKLS